MLGVNYVHSMYLCSGGFRRGALGAEAPPLNLKVNCHY